MIIKSWRKKMFKKLLMIFLPIVILSACSKEEVSREKENMEAKRMLLTIGEYQLAINTEDNAAVKDLSDLLKDGEIRIDMADYGGFEKVGYLGHELPSQDEEITTSPGDIVLYQGNQIVIFYDSNTWSYTPLGHIENLEMLKKALGSGNIEIILSLD